MQACIAPASFFFAHDFFGKGILASSTQDVHIPADDIVQIIVNRSFVVRMAHMESTSKNSFDTSICNVS